MFTVSILVVVNSSIRFKVLGRFTRLDKALSLACTEARAHITKADGVIIWKTGRPVCWTGCPI